MRYEWLTGLRYLAATRNARVPSIITLISVLAIAVGVGVMLLVFSVMGGFEADLRDKILAAKAHVLITGEARGDLPNAEAVLERVRSQAGVRGAAPFVESELLLTSRTNYTGVILRGIVPERMGETSRLPDEIIEGDLLWLNDPGRARGASAVERTDSASDALDRQIEELRASADALRAESERLSTLLEGREGHSEASEQGRSDEFASPRSRAMPGLPAPGTTAQQWQSTLLGEDVNPDGPGQEPAPRAERELPGILLGSELRTTLYVQVGDVVEVINPDGDIGPTGPIPSVHRFRVVGAFYTGLYEFDNRMAYAHVDEVRRMLDMPSDQVSGIEVLLEDMDRARGFASRLREELRGAGRGDVDVRDWTELNASLFGALMLEKVAMGLLLLVIVLVASFAVVCVLIMVVIQKRAEIAILRSMGAGGRGITSIFLIQGGALTLLGTGLGAVLGLGIVGYLAWVGVPLDPEVFYIDRVPVAVNPREVVAVLVGTLGIGLLATLYPSVQAARLEPSEGLREE